MASDVPGLVDESVVDPSTMTDRELLIRMDGKLSASIGVIVQGHSSLREEVADHEKRLRGVEKKLWYYSGAAVVIGVIAEQIAGPLLAHK